MNYYQYGWGSYSSSRAAVCSSPWRALFAHLSQHESASLAIVIGRPTPLAYALLPAPRVHLLQRLGVGQMMRISRSQAWFRAEKEGVSQSNHMFAAALCRSTFANDSATWQRFELGLPVLCCATRGPAASRTRIDTARRRYFVSRSSKVGRGRANMIVATDVINNSTPQTSYLSSAMLPDRRLNWRSEIASN